MATRTILSDQEPLLKKRSRTVDKIDERLKILIDDMKNTLAEADGVGLAAPQVGVLRRVVLIHVEGEQPTVLINPVLAETGDELCEDLEGCLSSPGVWGLVPRPTQVTVEALGEDGEPLRITGEGLTARALCHELDHLDGKLFLDLATRILDDEELDEWITKRDEAARIARMKEKAADEAEK